MSEEFPVIGVVVVGFRSPERTCAFVKEQLPRLPFPVAACVVDVASTKETQACLEENLPASCLRLFFAENLGYSRGNNRGAEALRTHCPGLKYLLVCNDDVLFDENSRLERMVEFLETHPECGIVGPDVQGTDGLPQSPWNTAADLGAKERFRRWRSPFGGPSRPCYAVRGCVLLVRAEAFFAVGGFDEEYFLFFEEPVLGEKFQKRGLGTWYLADARVTHLGSATIKKALSSWRIYRFYRRSFLLTARKYWGWSWARRFAWPLWHLLARGCQGIFH